MNCFLIRHGKDDESLRGGWSEVPLSLEGIEQIRQLATQLSETEISFAAIYSSDLTRAKQSAQILSDFLDLPIVYLPEFREVNNGALAGLRNEAASMKYSGLFWNTLEWDECYPEGESPKQFFDRITAAWSAFKEKCRLKNQDVLLVTHGGVINTILHMEKQIPYSNRSKGFALPYASVTKVEIE